MAKEKTKKSKKVVLVEKLISPTVEDAVAKIVEVSAAKKRKFNESVDISVNLNIDAKQSDQSVRGSVLLPNGSGKKVRAIVITADENKKNEAIAAGAIHAGFEDLIAKIEGGFVDFDSCIATPDIMPKISKIAKVLGPRGLMPSPKNGTVTTDVTKALSDVMKGKISFKNDKAGIVHCLVGKIDFKAESLVENINSVIKAIKDGRPEGAKGKLIKKVHLSSTMGPSVEVKLDNI